MRVGAAVFVTVLLAASQAAAQRPFVCPPDPEKIEMSFEVVSPSVGFSHEETIAEITSKAEGMHGTSETGGRVLGLTVFQPDFTIGGRYKARAYGNGYCVYLTQVHATFGYGKLDINVAREYPENSCAYRLILIHENDHVAVYKKALEFWAPHAREALAQGVAATEPRYAQDWQQAGRDMLEYLQARMGLAKTAFRAYARARNFDLDTPESYAEVFKACKDWRREPQ